MTREQAKQNLIVIGVAEPTDEQVSNYLNQVNGETKKEKERADGYKAKADAADGLQKQLDELQAGNLTELEKANKALDTANQQIAELQKNNAIRDLREKAMTDFKVTAEQAKTIVKEDGSFDTAELGKIMSEKETAAAQAKEQEIAKGSTNPGGGTAGGNKAGADNKTNAEKIAESLISNAPKNNDVLSHYIQQ
jgi:membrane-associated HD superfamily phosphohydrolase